MGARSKLNTVVVWTCLIVSALVGLAGESWGVFWGVLVVTIGGCYTAGDIRIRTHHARQCTKSDPEYRIDRSADRHRQRRAK
jgi:hypothetical protein